MSSVKISCPVQGCKFYGKIINVEFCHYIRHLTKDHDRNELIQLSFKKGIIQNPLGYQNHSFIIQQIGQFSKVK